ncbi:NYN domain-containing protein [Leucothrix arctica]|uniref:NYN domain-containing protein n=1 Tax=Leucothrix arctica TaxID=1481894 RepID=A0A317CF41_9GAMM|nr:NYN domain-containing protein [Leucothrix arctica]PWQ97265.1 hypothetical protein DKT75_06925 [Leucothrix arctica]
MNISKIAIFVDVENLTHWVKNSGPDDLLDELKSKGSTIVRKAYGNWSQPSISSLQVSLDRLGFDLVHSFHPVSGKNSADIQLTIDVIECALSRPDIDCFILATGDSDFSSLFRKLRSMGKNIIGVGPKSPLSKSVASSCSRYIFTDTPVRSNRLTSSGYNKASALARNTLRSLNGYAGCAELKKRMLEVDPTFDEKKHGFTTFRKFLERISAIKITPVTGSSDVMAYIEIKATPAKSNATQVDSNTPVVRQQLLENKESTLDMYKRFLRSHEWQVVPKHQLIRAYHLVSTMEPMTRSDIEYQVANDLVRELDINTVRQCINIFVKSGLLDLTLEIDEAGNDHKLLSLEKNVNYLKDVDFSMLTRLLQSIEDKQQEVDEAVIAQSLYNNYSDEVLSSLIADARTSLSLLRG